MAYESRRLGDYKVVNNPYRYNIIDEDIPDEEIVSEENPDLEDLVESLYTPPADFAYFCHDVVASIDTTAKADLKPGKSKYVVETNLIKFTMAKVENVLISKFKLSPKKVLGGKVFQTSSKDNKALYSVSVTMNIKAPEPAKNKDAETNQLSRFKFTFTAKPLSGIGLKKLEKRKIGEIDTNINNNTIRKEPKKKKEKEDTEVEESYREKSIYERYLDGEFQKTYHTVDYNYPNEKIIIEDTYREDRTYYNPEFDRIVAENFDLMDRKTRQSLIGLNEAEQNTVLAALTSKLYSIVVKKAADIDFGSIPESKGDITQIENYESLEESIILLKDIINEYKQDTRTIDVLSEALSNIQMRKEVFGKAFAHNIDFGILEYNTMVMSLMDGVSYLISTCIEFIKSPKDETFEIVFDKMRYHKSKDYLIYTNLAKFNASCKKGDFDKSLEYIVKENITQAVQEIAGVALATTTLAAKIVAGVSLASLIILIVPMLRELVFFFYYARVRIADFAMMQANLLQMNAYNIQYNDNNLSQTTKKEIITKQLKTAEIFRRIANFFDIDSRKAEAKAAKDIQAQEKEKVTIDDVKKDNEKIEAKDNQSSQGSLF